MNQHPLVMKYFPAPYTPQQSQQMVERVQQHFLQHGYGLWALELKSSGEFVGFCGLNHPSFQAHFTPCVEIGWRLRHEFWGRGLATEAAKQAMRIGFEQAGLPEIVSFTATLNQPSIRVMERLKMSHDPAEDYDHPSVPAEHTLCRHVLYRKRPD